MTTDAVRKTVTVRADVAEAFRIFTEGFDTWWPRTHHIGKSPLKEAIVEGRKGGRCYSKQDDGTDCDWGTVLEWDPPTRLVIAWQITHQWGYEADLAKSSEVDVRFTPVAGGTRVDLEHREFHRHGEGGPTMRATVDSPGGWGTILGLFAARAGGAQ